MNPEDNSKPPPKARGGFNISFKRRGDPSAPSARSPSPALPPCSPPPPHDAEPHDAREAGKLGAYEQRSAFESAKVSSGLIPAPPHFPRGGVAAGGMDVEFHLSEPQEPIIPVGPSSTSRRAPTAFRPSLLEPLESGELLTAGVSQLLPGGGRSASFAIPPLSLKSLESGELPDGGELSFRLTEGSVRGPLARAGGQMQDTDPEGTGRWLRG